MYKMISARQTQETPEAHEANKEILPVNWVMINQLSINSYYFQRGVLIVKPAHHVAPEVLSIGDRTFYFSDEVQFLKKSVQKYFKKKLELLQKLVSFSKTKLPIKSLILTESPRSLFNENRREEHFLPLEFSNHRGLYILPWTNTESLTDFIGFRQFVTAGCLFGGNLKGITEQGSRYLLIDHHLELPVEEKIIRIEYDFADLSNPFEIMLFSEFEKTCLLIEALSESERPKQLSYHLPALDYVLFGIKLFLKNTLVRTALQSFFDLVRVKRNEHIQKLSAIADQHEIIINFISPFDHLFPIEWHSAPLEQLLSQLGISDGSVTNEKMLVSRCIHLLQTQDFNLVHQEKWRKIFALNAPDNEISDIEVLFKFANALIIAIASHGLPHYHTCSILPLSEKQIQVHYDSLTKNSSLNFPAIINLTLFESVVAYSTHSKGLLFYFDCYLELLGKLLRTSRLVSQASINLGFFARGLCDQLISLEEMAMTPETLSNI